MHCMQVLLCCIVHSGHAAPRRRGAPRGPRAPRPCSICGQLGHDVRTCPVARAQRQQQEQEHASQRGGGLPCSICGQTGHYATQCPQARDQSCTICGQLGHNARTCPARDGHQEQPQREQRQHHACGVCGQPGHNARTCDRHAAATTAATEAAAAAGGSQFEQEDEQGGQHTVAPERVNLRTARRGGALSPATLPHLFAERPECVCDSCQRTFLCSSGSGSSPREVRNELIPDVCSCPAACNVHESESRCCVYMTRFAQVGRESSWCCLLVAIAHSLQVPVHAI